MKTVLMLGRMTAVLEEIAAKLSIGDVQLLTGTTLADVEAAFAEQPIVSVIMGAGLPIEDRLAIVAHVFATSRSTTVHMKDWDSGPAGMVPFVQGVIAAL